MESQTFRSIEVRRADLRWPFPERFAARLRGRKVTRLTRRAKYLLADLSGNEVLLMHLGMSGSFRVTQNAALCRPGRFHHPRSAERGHDHVVFYMSSGATVTFNDPRRFGFMLLIDRAELAQHPLLISLGPEPLDPDFDAVTLARGCAGKKTSLKAALLDQRVVAGLGNIYVCEALNLAQLSPRRRAGTIALKTGAPSERAAALVVAIKEVLNAAIRAGGSSLRDHRRTNGELGDFQHSFRVYDRAGKPCPTAGCSGVIRRIVQAGRSTFYCPVCQR